LSVLLSLLMFMLNKKKISLDHLGGLFYSVTPPEP
jgi:hypothetical protein